VRAIFSNTNCLFFIFLLEAFFMIIQQNRVFAQNNKFSGALEAQLISTNRVEAPFWFRVRQEGSIPLAGASVGIFGNLKKEYDTTSNLFDWGAGIAFRTNFGSRVDFNLISGYIKGRASVFEIKLGRWNNYSGLSDTLLSTGSFGISGNALAIPQIQISIPQYYNLPFLNGWVGVRGSLSHGWIGSVPIQFGNVSQSRSFFHSKALYGRIGKQGGVYSLIAGFNHNAFWGNERNIYSGFDLSNWQAYQSVLYGKTWGGSKVGNHLGSIDIEIEANWNRVNFVVYRQFFYEKGGLYHLANIADGLNGITLINKAKQESDKGIKWERALFEFLYSKNQGGYLSSPETPSGAEDYYNHYIYAEGWSYKGLGLGNPLFTPRREARDSLAHNSSQFFINNRLMAFHIGGIVEWKKWEVLLKATYSQNYGTYATGNEQYRSSYGEIKEPQVDQFVPVAQTSLLLSVKKPISNKTYIGVILGVDAGKLLNSTSGVIIKGGAHF